MQMRYIPIVGGLFASACVLTAIFLAPYMPTQAELAPEQTAKLAQWARVGDALAVQRMVEQGACVEAVAEDGTSALMTAAAEGHLEVLRVLLMHSAQVNATNDVGDTPLHFAATSLKPEVCALLLESGASVNARNKRGVTPLMVAAGAGADSLVQQLLTAGADTALVDDQGNNAADYARRVQDPLVRDVILKLLGA